MPGYKTQDDLVLLLKEQIKTVGDKKKLAQNVKVSQAMISSVLCGRDKIGVKIPNYLGYRRVVLYEPLKRD